MASTTPPPSDFIHYSQISTYLTCGQKHDFAYRERLEPRTFHERMSRGTLGHAVFEDKWKGQNGVKFKECLDDLFLKQRNGRIDETVDIGAMGEEIGKVALRAFEKVAARFEVYKDHVEKSLLWEMFPGVWVGGTPDVVVQDKSDRSIWILDYKFRSAFLDAESELLNLQMIFYSKLLREVEGVSPHGTRQVQIAPHLPKEPKMTKGGAMSRADCKTDWETYSAALVRNGLDPNDYLEMQEKLAGKVFVDMDTCRAIRADEEVDFHMNKSVIPAVRSISNADNIGMRCYNSLVCSGCNYRELCVEDAKGGDTAFMRNTLYKIKGEDDHQDFVLEEDV